MIDHEPILSRVFAILNIMVFHDAIVLKVATAMHYTMNGVIYPGMNNFP